jgi:SagB-type dehydrogenase family enzyme
VDAVHGYHETTKHSFNRFARSLGYLDWAAQPDPFRRYEGAPRLELPRGVLRPAIPYAALFDGSAPPAPIDAASIGEFLRCSMGLSAWKQHEKSRWALRVNPSSGNLHPTETYIVWNGRVCHYAPREHALEIRAEGVEAARQSRSGETETFVVGLTSILWREAWKYGERAFRYCQHDVGHAIGAVRFAAALLGWRVSLLDGCSQEQVATILGVDRAGDYGDAEREEPECLLLVAAALPARDVEIDTFVGAAKHAIWAGHANVLSRSRVDWPVIDEVARATRKGGSKKREGGTRQGEGLVQTRRSDDTGAQGTSLTARQVIIQRRSALGFDASSSLPRERFLAMLRRLRPGASPWDVLDWPAQVHLALFVHRVDDLHPGLYIYLRDAAAADELRRAMRSDFLWEPANEHDSNDLFLLVPTDVRFAANRLSCDQDIAADGFFSLGMLARLTDSLHERGDWFYRQLFWECGVIGQVLYLEAEAAGARATGIGCFYDDPVHEVLGLSGLSWQSLYHFSMGVPVDDGRLTTDPGYAGGW